MKTSEITIKKDTKMDSSSSSTSSTTFTDLPASGGCITGDITGFDRGDLTVKSTIDQITTFVTTYLYDNGVTTNNNIGVLLGATLTYTNALDTHTSETSMAASGALNATGATSYSVDAHFISPYFELISGSTPVGNWDSSTGAISIFDSTGAHSISLQTIITGGQSVFEFTGSGTTLAPRFNLSTVNANSALSLDTNKGIVSTQLTTGQVLLGSTGVAPVATTILYTSSPTTAFNAGSTDISATMHLRQTGNTVTVSISGFDSPTTGSALMTTSTSASPAPIPMVLRPSVAQQFTCIVHSEGTYQTQVGLIEFLTTGDINVYFTPVTNNFPSTTGGLAPSGGSVSQTFTYVLS